MAVRYHADSQRAMAAAVLAVLHHARSTSDDYTFGPLDLNALMRDGLLLDGNTAALEAQLDRVPGLASERV